MQPSSSSGGIDEGGIQMRLGSRLAVLPSLFRHEILLCLPVVLLRVLRPPGQVRDLEIGERRLNNLGPPLSPARPRAGAGARTMSGLVVVATTRSNVLRIGGIMKLDVLSAWELRRRECERVPVRGHRHPMRVGRPEVHDSVAAPANVPLIGNIMLAGC
jgi:hypothetical protein